MRRYVNSENLIVGMMLVCLILFASIFAYHNFVVQPQLDDLNNRISEECIPEETLRKLVLSKYTLEDKVEPYIEEPQQEQIVKAYVPPELELICCYPESCPQAKDNPDNCNCLYTVECIEMSEEAICELTGGCEG